MSTRPQGRAPLTVDVDFRTVLDNLGDATPFDPDSLHVVVQRCDLGWPEVPGQFVDRLQALTTRTDHVAAAGDERGAVVFLYDTDDNLRSTETLRSGTTTFALYFSSAAQLAPSVPGPTTDLSLTYVQDQWRLETGVSTMLFDPDQGGLMSAISRGASGYLTSQTASCCGNGMHFWDPTYYNGPPWGWVTPQSAPGDVEVLADGPVFAAIRATGTRDGIVPGTGQDFGTTSYDALYWAFAGRPELWHVTTQAAVTDATTTHEIDASFGFRPLQTYHDPVLAIGARYRNDAAARWGAVIGATHGIAIGVPHPPTHHARIANPVGVNIGAPPVEEYFAIHGNELAPPGTPTPFTVPAGTRYFDNVGIVMLPFAGAWSAARPAFDAVMAPAAAAARPAEWSP